MPLAFRVATSVADNALVPFRFRERQLNTRPHRRGDLEGALFIAEGDLVVMRALASGYHATTLLCGEAQCNELQQFATQLESTDLVVADEAIRREATGLAVALNMIGLFVKPANATLTEVITHHKRVVMLSQVDNPTNVGAIMRSAMAFGFHGIVLDTETSDPFGRRALRVSMGTSFSASIARSDNLGNALHELHGAGFTSCALTPSNDAVSLDEVASIEKLVLILGSERDGLDSALLENASMQVRIPMSSGIDSLNVAAAAAVACYGLTNRKG